MNPFWFWLILLSNSPLHMSSGSFTGICYTGYLTRRNCWMSEKTIVWRQEKSFAPWLFSSLYPVFPLLVRLDPVPCPTSPGHSQLPTVPLCNFYFLLSLMHSLFAAWIASLFFFVVESSTSCVHSGDSLTTILVSGLNCKQSKKEIDPSHSEHRIVIVPLHWMLESPW